VRQPDVHNNEIWNYVFQQLERMQRVACLDYIKPARFEKVGKQSPATLVVFYDEYLTFLRRILL